MLWVRKLDSSLFEPGVNFNIKCIGKSPGLTNEFERSLVFETGEFERPKFDCINIFLPTWQQGGRASVFHWSLDPSTSAHWHCRRWYQSEMKSGYSTIFQGWTNSLICSTWQVPHAAGTSRNFDCLLYLLYTYKWYTFWTVCLQKAGARNWGFLIQYHYPLKRSLCRYLLLGQSYEK